jgi:UDP-hydrolysing UDP-N-acetyl-D-glucosamine 2-epimerase
MSDPKGRIRKVCVVTGSRAEYGLFYPILMEIQHSENLALQLIVSSMHLSNEFGLTYQQIERDGFIINDKIENLLVSDSLSAVAKSTGLAIILLSDSLKRLVPDVLLLLGDRYETHAAATTAMLMNIPIAHIHGGEITEGAIDEKIRHSITKMSSLHFTSTEIACRRVIQMGETDSRVFNVGAPGIDNILNLSLLSKVELELELGWSFGQQTMLFTYHPETLNQDDNFTDILMILSDVTSDNEMNVLFTYANADSTGRKMNIKLEEFCKVNPEKYKVVKNLGQKKYLSVMNQVDLMVGNSSSGIIEAASFNLPVVNIGDRQKGREQSGNVLHCSVSGLKSAVNRACSNAFIDQCKKTQNIYGDGKSASKMVRILASIECLEKQPFIDI